VRIRQAKYEEGKSGTFTANRDEESEEEPLRCSGKAPRPMTAADSRFWISTKIENCRVLLYNQMIAGPGMNTEAIIVNQEIFSPLHRHGARGRTMPMSSAHRDQRGFPRRRVEQEQIERREDAESRRSFENQQQE